MAIEKIVGLHISDDELYQKYRDAMLPLLESYGGSFGYDFLISKVLKSQTTDKINRVFTLAFKNESSMDDFFSDENYLSIRKKYFEPAVSATTLIAKYTK